MAPITPIKAANNEALLKFTFCLIPTKIKAAIQNAAVTAEASGKSGVDKKQMVID